MRDVAGKVAVVTGGASGIGRALCERFAAAGMSVVAADVEEEALAAVERALRDGGARTLAVRTDVSRAADVEALARRTLDAFGAVHVVCNNAGVSLAGPLWEHTLEDWQWLLGVNLWGVVHGLRTFVPILLAQGTPGHVVNTASIAGLTSTPFLGVYNVSKHAVVTMSETLAQELALQGASVKVSVLCPGFVNTRILDSSRNRPGTLAPGAERPRPPELEQAVRRMIEEGMPPREVAEQVFRAIEEERFWVLTHPEVVPRLRERLADMIEGRVPVPRLVVD